MHGNGGLTHANVLIEAEPNSHAIVLLRHSGSAQVAANVEILVRDGAHLTVITVQQWADDAVHAASHQARVDRDATLRHIVVSFGGGVVRINPSVELAGTGSQAQLYGLSFSDAGQHLESQVYLYHKGAETRGDVLYKGALQGAGARSVWIGDVLIGPDAVGTDSYEANRNLVLTDGARAESIPNLEIETGDIRGAGHASATGRFDDEQLFYLQARGISEDEARRLVVIGFLSEIVQRIGIPELEAELSAAIEAELKEGTAAVTATRVCSLSELEQDTPKRVVVKKVPIAVVLDSDRRGARDRRHLHARRHLPRRGLRRGRQPRVLGPRLGLLAAHRPPPEPPRV